LLQSRRKKDDEAAKGLLWKRKNVWTVAKNAVKKAMYMLTERP